MLHLPHFNWCFSTVNFQNASVVQSVAGISFTYSTELSFGQMEADRRERAAQGPVTKGSVAQKLNSGTATMTTPKDIGCTDCWLQRAEDTFFEGSTLQMHACMCKAFFSPENASITLFRVLPQFFCAGTVGTIAVQHELTLCLCWTVVWQSSRTDVLESQEIWHMRLQECLCCTSVRQIKDWLRHMTPRFLGTNILVLCCILHAAPALQ